MISVMQGLFVGKWNESFPRTILTIFRAPRNFNDRPGFTNWCSSYWHAYCISGNSFAARSAPQNPPNWAKPPATRATQTGSALATCRAVALPNERQKLKHYMEVSWSSTTADYFLLCSGRISCYTLKTRRQTKIKQSTVRIDEAVKKINRLCNTRSRVSRCNGFSCVWTRRVKT